MFKKMIGILFLVILIFWGLSEVYNYYFSQSLTLSPLQSKQVKSCHDRDGTQDRNKSTVRILVVDGGGINGIMPLVLLNYLEEKTGKPISSLFDFYTGTSTGSIIVSTLNIPTATGQPKYTAKRILELYTTFSKKVLNASLLRQIFTLKGLIAPRLSIDVLHRGFQKLLGREMTFGQLVNHVAITAFNITDKKLTIFNSWDCDSPVSRYLVGDIITAAVATPTMFSPVFFSEYQNHHPAVFVDGMIFANNPSLSAIEEAFNLYPNAKKFIIVHLGTGGNSIDFLNLTGEKIQSWGAIRWMYPMATILYKAQNLVIKNAIASIQHFSSSVKFKYYYFSKNLDFASPFDTSEANIKNVGAVANTLLQAQKKELDKVASQLIAVGN